MKVVLIELHDVFNKVLNRDGLHVICTEKTQKSPFVQAINTWKPKLFVQQMNSFLKINQSTDQSIPQLQKKKRKDRKEKPVLL